MKLCYEESILPTVGSIGLLLRTRFSPLKSKGIVHFRIELVCVLVVLKFAPFARRRSRQVE